MNVTGIEWTTFSANPLKYRDKRTGEPVWGCVKKSAGCANCYSEALAKRYGRGGPFTRAEMEHLEPFLDEGELRKMLTAKTIGGVAVSGSRCFVGDMTDVFGEWVKCELLDRLFAVFALRPDVTWQVLTKRADRMATWASDPQTPYRVAKAVDVMMVREAMEQIEERIVPVADYPGYMVSNTGTVYSGTGSSRCLHCGESVGGIATKRYCSKKCKQNAAYHRSAGHEQRHEPDLKPLSPDVGEQGHQRVMLYRGGGSQRELVHRLVLTAFDRPPRDGEQACHRDGDPSNNHIANLRWGTQSNNWADRKRHGNGRSWSKLTDEQVENIRHLLACGRPASRLAADHNISETQVRNIDRYEQWAANGRIEWPLTSVWCGVSVENQAAADERIPHLLRVPAAVRFLSCEPLLGPVTLPLNSVVAGHPAWKGDPNAPDVAKPMLHWVIVGGESGHGARPMHPAWARSLRGQCNAAGVAFFFKQWGEWAPLPEPFHYTPAFGSGNAEYVRALSRYAKANGCTRLLDDRPEGWGATMVRDGTCITDGGLPIGDVGKKAAGRLLDGREWDEFPTPTEA